MSESSKTEKDLAIDEQVIEQIPEVESPNFRFEERKEKIGTRKVIALGLFIVISMLVFILPLGVIFKFWTIEDMPTLSSIMISPILGIFGTVMGFYFGENKEEK